MALKTQSKTVVGSLGHHQITMTVNEDSINTTNNTSTISFTITLGHAGTYYGFWWEWNYNDPITITYTIEGVTNTCTLRKYQTDSTVTVKTGSQIITHNNNGAKILSWSFSFTSQSGYSYLPGSGSSGTQSLTLTTIPRETTFGSKTPSSCTLKNSMTVYFDRKSDSYTHRLYYKIGSTETEITSGAVTDSSKKWTPGISLASNNKTGTSFSCTLIIRTYNGSTKIGSDITKAITLNIPNDDDTKPTISIAVNDGKKDGDVEYKDKYGGYVQSKSSIKTVVTAGKKNSTYGADISSYSVVYRQGNASGSVLASGTSSSFSWTPTQSGTIHITATVTDKRGFSRSTTSTATVVAYANPTFSSFSVRRYPDGTDTTPSDVGGYARVTYGANYSPLSNKNTLSVTVKYKEHSATSYVTPALLDGGHSASATTNAFKADVAKVYDVRIILKDNFNTSENIYKDLSLSTASSFMHWPVGGNGIAFGKMSEEPGTFEIGYNKLKLIGKTDQPELLLEHRLKGYRADIYIMNADAPALAMGLYDESENWYPVTRMYKEGLYPYTNKVANLGSIGYQWHNICGETIYENGVSLANKYHPKMELTNLGATSSKAVANNTWVTVQTNTFTEAGTYLIIAWADWTSSFNNQTNFRLRLSRSGNSSVADRTVRFSASGGGGAVNAVFWSVSANDVLNMDAWQASGSSKNAHTAGHWLKIG